MAAMTPDAYRAALARLDMSQARLSRLLDHNKQTTNRWAQGTRPIPRSVELLLAAWAANPELIPDE